MIVAKSEGSSVFALHRVITYIRQARWRAKRRKSLWNLVLIPLCLLGIVCAGWVFFLPIQYLQDALRSESAFLAGSTNIGKILLICGLLICSIVPGLMLGNIFAWLVVPLRRIFDREAQAYPSTNFKTAMKQLTTVAIVIFIVVYPLALLGGLNYFSVDSEGISYQEWFSLDSTKHGWTQIKKIETRCWSKGMAGRGSFKVSFYDGLEIDLFSAGPKKFFSAYPRLSSLLQNIPFEFLHEPKYFGQAQAPACPPTWIDYFVRRP